MDFKVFNPGNTVPYSKRVTTVGIIAHHAAAIHCTPADIVRWHLARGFNGAGYNWFIAKDGTKYQLRPIWATGAHTIGWNSKTIGICCEGNYETEASMPDAQKKSYAEVIDYCNDCYCGDGHGTKLPVWPHKAKWPTACPGKNLPFASIVNMADHWDDKPVIPFPGRQLKDVTPDMFGTDIRAVQQRLNDLGYRCGRTDGYFGRLTRAAVLQFQKAHSLKVDGIVGKYTWEKLFN